MKLESVGEVIATRTLFLANDQNCKIVVKLGKPQLMPPSPDAVGDHYYCPFQITGIGSEKVTYAGGVDAFQSLELVGDDRKQTRVSQQRTQRPTSLGWR